MLEGQHWPLSGGPWRVRTKQGICLELVEVDLTDVETAADGFDNTLHDDQCHIIVEGVLALAVSVRDVDILIY